MRKIYAQLILYFSVILICSTDILTGSKFSIKVILILPFYIYISLYSKSLRTSNIFAVFVAISWTYIDFHLIYNSSYIELLFNLLIRVAALLLLAYLIFKIKIQRKLLKDLNDDLEKAIIEKNEFVGMAAHDLRSPINTIFSFANLLLDTENSNLNQKQLKYIQSIKSVSGKMILLLNDTLNLTSIESGTLVLSKQPYEYFTTINEVVKEIKVFANKKKIHIELDKVENKIMLNIDRKRIGQVLDNLLSNAIKFSKPHTSIIIKVRQNDGFVTTEIIDQGVGIKDSEIEQVFKPFVKTSSKPTEGEDSTGLGLAIVKKIIEAHGGEISVTSKQNVGSTFGFTLQL